MPDTVVSDRTNVVQIARQTLSGSVDVVTEDSSLLVEVRTDDWFGSPLAEYGGVLREASAEPDETMILVEVPRQADVRSFVERLQSIAERQPHTVGYTYVKDFDTTGVKNLHALITDSIKHRTNTPVKYQVL